MGEQQYLSTKNLKTLIKVAEMGDDARADLMRAAQAILEKKPFGESSLDDKLIDYGYGFFATDTPMSLNGVSYRRHVNGGGYVPVEQDERSPIKAYIREDAYIGPWVRISGNAKIFNGTFCGGEFRGGEFYEGYFLDGTFYDGVFHGGEFRGGYFYGGYFRGGSFRRGYFFDGRFFDGIFIGGEFRGGTYNEFSKTYESTTDADPKE